MQPVSVMNTDQEVKEAVNQQSNGVVIVTVDDVKAIQRYQDNTGDLQSAVALFLTQRMLSRSVEN